MNEQPDEIMTSSKYRHITDELLSAYLDDAVSDQERQLIERAVASDNDVAWRLESLRQTVALLSTLPELSLPRSFVLSPEHLQAGGNTVAARPPQQAAPVSRPAARTTERDTGAPEAGWWEEFLAGWRDFWQAGNVALRNAAAVSLVLMLALFGGSAYLGTAAREVQIASAPAASESAAESVAVAPTAPAQTGPTESVEESVEESVTESVEDAAPAQAPAAADARTASDTANDEAAQEPVEQPPAPEASATEANTAASVAAEADSEQPATEQPVTEQPVIEQPVTEQAAADQADAAIAEVQGTEVQGAEAQEAAPASEAPQAQAAMTASGMPRMEDVPPGILIPGGPEGIPVDPNASGGIGGAGGDMGSGDLETIPGMAPNARMFPPEAYEPLPTPLPTETPSTQSAVTDTEIYSDTVAPPEPAAPMAAAEVSTVSTGEVSTGEVSTDEAEVDTAPEPAATVTDIVTDAVTNAATDASATATTPAEVALVRPSPQPTATATATETETGTEPAAAQAAVDQPAETTAETTGATAVQPVLAIAQAASALITLMLASLWWRSRRR